MVANATHCRDGAWRSLDARWIYGYARTAGFLYQAELRRQLTARLGVSWTDVDKGVAEIAGIDRRVLRELAGESRSNTRSEQSDRRSEPHAPQRSPPVRRNPPTASSRYDRLAYAGRRVGCRHRGGRGADHPPLHHRLHRPLHQPRSLPWNSARRSAPHRLPSSTGVTLSVHWLHGPSAVPDRLISKPPPTDSSPRTRS